MDLFLDNRTQTIIQVGISLTLCIVMLIAARTQFVYPGFRYWAYSKIPQAIGWALISLNGVIPIWISVIIGNAALGLHMLLMYSGIRKFRDKPDRNLLNIILLFLLVTGFIYFTLIIPNYNGRMFIQVVYGAILLGSCGLELVFGVPKELRLSYWFSASMLFLPLIIYFIRVITYRSLPQLAGPFGVDQVQNVVFMAVNILGIGWTFGFFMMTNQRLIYDLLMSEKQLRELADKDYLTGIFNRSAFIERSHSVIAMARRNRHPVCLMILDIDHFKHVNDHYGHPTGDIVLCSLATALSNQIRQTDILARWGGEEFTILLPETSEVEGVKIAERLVETVAHLSMPIDSGSIQITISIGIGILDLAEENITRVLSHADKALYLAKQSGRNRVKLYDQLELSA